MEKVVKCEKGSTSVKDGVTTQWYNITGDSGKVGTSKVEMKEGDEVVFAEYKEYKGKMTYWANAPREAKKGFAPKETKRRDSLDFALVYRGQQSPEDKAKMKADDTLALAEKFYTYLAK